MSSSSVWIPGMAAGPLEEFVNRLHRGIEAYAREAGIERAFVEVELADGSRYSLDRVSPEPGFGFVTLRPHARPDDEDVPEAIVVHVGTIRRIDLSRAEDQRERFGFTLPDA
jgi:hypothetical protein